MTARRLKQIKAIYAEYKSNAIKIISNRFNISEFEVKRIFDEVEYSDKFYIVESSINK